MPSANDFLMGSGTPTAKFPTIGSSVSGVIVDEPEVRQQTDFDDGSLLFWDDGNPRMQLVIRLQTDLRDPEVENDDGVRALYVKGQNVKTLREAIKSAGRDGVEPGGWLAAQYTHDGQASGKKNPPHLHAYTYKGPTAQAANAFLNAGSPPAPAPVSAAVPTTAPAAAPVMPPPIDQQAFAAFLAQQQAQQAQQQLPVAQPVQPVAPPMQPVSRFTPEQLAAMRNAGIDPATVLPA